ncbi:FMN reductase [Nocardioides gansuensis]|uniref:FMN reductase n=1 Tax=Nocardioides gansuensis TaxID=2138300 RepID=A0A2T8F743_9ACTN|nr:NAD(P)H-dependent oxidoreductase [Nocardioides gansuensis]PVG81487.1 FMN reductase [Nocardioides gansuensis]
MTETPVTQTPSETRVLALVGSLRAGSLNRRLAEVVRDQAPAGVTVEIAEGLDALPFYNEDLDGDAAPEAVRAFRDQVAAADRILVLTPEYNGTMPAVLNNAIDWASRPFGEGAIKGKVLGVVGTAVGQYGGQWAHEDARKSAKVAGANVADSVALSHAYAWGSDPTTDPETVQAFVDSLGKLVAHESVA